MRLVLIGSEFPPGPGGIGTHAYQLALHLEKMGWDVWVCSPQHYASEEEISTFNQPLRFRVVRLHTQSLNVVRAVRGAITIIKTIRRVKPDVLIASGERLVWLTAFLTSFLKMPWIAVGHGIEFGDTGIWRRTVTRWAYQKATAVVCVSEYTKGQMRALGVKQRAARVIPNGADEEQFGIVPVEEVKAFRAGLGFGNDTNVLLTVGRVSRRKGQDIVIRALPRVLAEEPNTHYVIAGLATLRDDLEKLAIQLGVADHVHFLGRVDVDTLVRALNGCNVFVMTSRHTDDGDFEGYGIAVVEAALCGKPAVVSNESGLAEAIVEGGTGFGVPEEDVEATAEKILLLLKDKELQKKIGAQARRRALHEQVWSRRVRDYDELLRDLVRRDQVHAEAV
ncbi:MAG: glycosyltransferase family 4 protein [Rhodothermales bacterium]